MIDLACVASFLAVAETGGFRAAAQRVGLSQPAVTQHIRKLERWLRAELIDRGNAGSVLTPQGRAFLPYAEILVRTSERAQAMFEKKNIVVGASSNIGIYLLPKHLKACSEALGLELDIVIGANPDIADRLQNLAIDVAFTEWWDERPGFVAQCWKQERLVVIVPPGHPWADRESIPAALLQNATLLGGEAGTGTGRLLRQCLGERAAGLRTGMQLGSTEAVKRAVEAGLGISIVMASAVADEQSHGRLRAIPLADAPLEKSLYITWRDHPLHENPAARFARCLLDSGAGRRVRQ